MATEKQSCGGEISFKLMQYIKTYNINNKSLKGYDAKEGLTLMLPNRSWVTSEAGGGGARGEQENLTGGKF